MSSYNNSGETLGELSRVLEPTCNRGKIDEYTIDLLVNSADNTLLLLTFISTALQIHVLRRALRQIRRSNIDQCLHIFILSMTFGDFLLTGFCYPLEFISRMELVAVPKIIHQAVHFFTWVALLGSSLSLVLLNVEKLIYFKYSLSSLVTRRRGVSSVTMVWYISVLFVSASWYLKYFKCVDKNCLTLNLFGNNMGMYITYMVVSILLFQILAGIAPTITSLAVSCYTLNFVSKLSKNLEEEVALNHANRSAVTSTIGAHLRTFYFTLIATVFTAATLLPFRIYQVKLKFFKDSYSTDITVKKDCSQIFIQWVMSYLLILNALLNPLITVTILPQYRLRFVKKVTSSSTNFQTTTF